MTSHPDAHGMDQHHRHSHTSASSVTTYHSFNDQVELFEPASPPRTDSDHSGTSTPRSSSRRGDGHGAPNHRGRGQSSEGDRSSSRPSTAVKMQRQDSGYESYTASPRTSVSSHQPSVSRRLSSKSTTKANNIHNPSSSVKHGSRPSTRRSATSYSAHPRPPLYLVRSAAHPSLSSQDLHPSRPSSTHQGHPSFHSSTTFFQFPSPEQDMPPPHDLPHHDQPQHQLREHTPTLPPQTTHYWTSDRTRRLEYAAIDAASRGVKAWIRRNLVPDCFLPRDDRRHLAFDDDTGSVRRYRLDLEEESGSNCAMSVVGLGKASKRKVWPFSA